jgi:endonuclease/exonuclease/phosphatase family metal-dependent hydrolase
MTDLMAAYEKLTTTLRDVHRERGWGLGHTFLIPRGFGFPSDVNLPVQRIDYIFHSPDIDATDSQVLSGEGGSDHLPVMAQFDLRP